jgi:hypothetical protein
MGFKDKAELTPLIPAMDIAICTTAKAKTFIIESCAIEFSLWILLTKGSIFKKLFSSISWVPKL